MLKNYISIMRGAALAALLMCGASLMAQTTATGVINGTLVNKNGISIQFDTDPAGVTLGAAGTNAATANFGTVSAFGPLSAGVTRPSVTAANFTVRTIFDVQVVQGGLNSTTYTLTANSGRGRANRHELQSGRGHADHCVADDPGEWSL